jgi:hypothetical protein
MSLLLYIQLIFRVRSYGLGFMHVGQSTIFSLSLLFLLDVAICQKLWLSVLLIARHLVIVVQMVAIYFCFACTDVLGLLINSVNG